MKVQKRHLRKAIAFASCALVNGSSYAEQGAWKASGSFLYYGEKQRVTAAEPAVFATQDIGDEQTLGIRVVYDTVTGSSPNGASVSDKTQTIGSTTVTANTLPLEKFSDKRAAVGIDWIAQTSPLLNRTVALNVSNENDYRSIGGSGTWLYDYNQKLTTLAFGIGLAYDTLQPRHSISSGLQSISGIERPGQTMTGVSGATNYGGGGSTTTIGGGGSTTTTGGGGTTTSSGSGTATGGGGNCTTCKYKSIGDLMLGITQVLDRHTLMQANYYMSYQEGYLTDPYKILSVVDSNTGDTTDYIFEQRPSTRLANALYLKLVRHFDEDVAHLSYRHFFDSWGIRAHTAELKYRVPVSGSFYVEPQFRYYQQTGAKFFHHSVPSNMVSSLDYASADLRLADMSARTAGIKMGVELDGNTELSARFMKMTEVGDSHPSDAIGGQRSVDMYPKLEATIVTVSFSTSL